MTVTSWVSDLFTVHAESATTVVETPSNTESVSSKADDGADAAEEADESEEAEAEEPEAEEEEEEEEPEDEMPTIREQCESTKACAPYKHHFDECQERVTAAAGEDSHGHEDCVEEMFHLMHCVDECSANKVFAKLK